MNFRIHRDSAASRLHPQFSEIGGSGTGPTFERNKYSHSFRDLDLIKWFAWVPRNCI